jgi:amino acid permease
MLVCTEYSAVATIMQYWNTSVNPAVWVAMALIPPTIVMKVRRMSPIRRRILVDARTNSLSPYHLTDFYGGVMLVCTEYSAVATIMQYWNTSVNPAVWVEYTQPLEELVSTP